MLTIDNRFNIEKTLSDCQMMKLQLFNVNIENVENGIIKIYNKDEIVLIPHYKYYEECDYILFFFLINNNIKVGDYKYNVEITLKENCKINVLSERSFKVYD